jgi:putative membrane protein
MKRVFTFLTFLFLSAPVALMARWRGDGTGYWAGCDFGRYFDFGGRGIMMILTIVILVLLIIWAVKTIKTGQTNPFKTQDPLTILKTRYAKGEISKEEYNEMKKEM